MLGAAFFLSLRERRHKECKDNQRMELSRREKARKEKKAGKRRTGEQTELTENLLSTTVKCEEKEVLLEGLEPSSLRLTDERPASCTTSFSANENAH
jgi:hypothetical protein